MHISSAILLVTTGVINIVANLVLLWGIVSAKRRTPTNIYMAYMVILWLIKQIISPAFHEWLSETVLNYDEKRILTLAYTFVLIGTASTMMLLFLMDYFKWISNYNYFVVIAHFLIILSFLLIYYFVVEPRMIHVDVAIFSYFIITIILIVILLIYAHVDYFKKRKDVDDESLLRYRFVLAHVLITCAVVVVFLIEQCLIQLFYYHYNETGIVAFSLYQLDAMFYLVVLNKTDDRFFKNMFNLFKVCSFKRKEHMPFENPDNVYSPLPLAQTEISV